MVSCVNYEDVSLGAEISSASCMMALAWILAMISPVTPVSRVIGTRANNHHTIIIKILIGATAIAVVDSHLLVGTLIRIAPGLFVVTASVRSFPIIIVRRR